MSDLELDDLNEEFSFGEWAKSVRERKNLSLQKVAADAKISYVALYKIERGDIKNPREATKGKIEDALGEKADKSSDKVSKTDPLLKGIGALEDFDPYDLETVPDDAGVYVLYDISQRPIYVGRSKKLRNRIRTHYDRFWFKEPIVTTGSFIAIKEETLRNQVEKILISFLKSNAVINKKLVDRDLED